MKKQYLISSTVLALAIPAFGQSVISDTDTFVGDIDFTDTVSLAKFDGTLGELLSVEFCYTLDADGGTLGLDNEGESSATIGGDFGVQLSVTASSVNLLDASYSPILDGLESTYTVPTTTLAANDGDNTATFDPSGPDYVSFTATGTSNSGSGFVNTVFFAQYVGSGDFTIDFEVDSIFNLSGEGGSTLLFDSPDTANGTVTVKYTYAPVPEPSSSALLGLGALGFIIRRKR